MLSLEAGHYDSVDDYADRRTLPPGFPNDDLYPTLRYAF